MIRRVISALMVRMCLTSFARAEETEPLALDRTSIRGNEELPKVLTIVPWKDASLSEIDSRPADRLVDDALAPVDREVFLRQQRYFEQLYSAGARAK